MKKRFGEILLERRLINESQLTEALALQRRKGMRLGAALVQLGALTEAQLVSALGALLNIKVVHLQTVHINPEAVRAVSYSFASENDLFPFAVRNERGRRIITVAMSDPLNFRIIDELSFITNSQIEAVLARWSEIDRAIRENYIEAFGAIRDLGDASLRIDTDDSDGKMTILKRGGGERTVDTGTGKVASPYIKKKDDEALESAPVNLPPGRGTGGEEISAVLLTDEVDAATPLDPVRIDGVMPKPPHMTIVEADAPIPLTKPKNPSQRPSQAPIPSQVPSQTPSQIPVPSQVPTAPPTVPTSTFDAELGALIDAAGGVVNADAFYRLERRFWALMRVLAKKGILNNEDFLRELGEEEMWYPRS